MATPNVHKAFLVKTMYQTLNKMHLRPLRRVHIKFDPFHPNTLSLRDFMFHLNAETLRLTNPQCAVRTEVVSDRSAPQIDILLNEGQKYRIFTEYLTTPEIIQQIDKISRAFDPKKDEAAS